MGAAKGKRLPRAVRERQMLDAAVTVFAQRGYRAASMDEIAELAGVSKPLVYLYLNSKEDLFSACIRREAEALVEAVRKAADAEGGSAGRQLQSGLLGFFTHTAEHPDGWLVLHHQARTPGEPFTAQVAAVREEFVGLVTGLIAAEADRVGRAAKPAEREVSGLAHALVGAAESLAGWANGRGGDGSPSATETATLLMDFAWAGLENLLAGQRWSSARL